MANFLQSEYKKSKVEMTSLLVFTPGDGREHKSKLMIDWSDRNGNYPVRIDELVPGARKTLSYFRDYVEKSVYFKGPSTTTFLSTQGII